MLKLHSIALELTPRCNQKCVYCYNSWRGSTSDAPDELSTAQVRRIVDRILADAEVEQFTLTGGEPFLRRDLPDIIDHIKARGRNVTIISNAALVDPSKATDLAKRNVGYVQVTLAGPDRKRHDALCGGGSFDNVGRGVAALVGAGVPVGGSFLCTRRSHASARATLERMWQMGIRQHFAFNRFNPSGYGAAAVMDLLPRRSDVLEALSQSNGFAQEHAVQIHCTMPLPPCMVEERQYGGIQFGQCSVGTEQAEYAVGPRAQLRLCTLQKRSIGNVLKKGLAELLSRHAAEKFRAATPTFCRPCPHRDVCLGGCRAAAEWVFGRRDQLDPFIAQHVMPDYAARISGSTGKRWPAATVPSRHDAHRVRVDLWYDLVYHVLSHLPIDSRDASSLYDERYVAWSSRHFAAMDSSGGHLPRTLAEDAALIARLYDASEGGALVQAWPMLHDNVRDFLRTINKGFAQLAWPDGAQESLASSIRSAVHPALPDLLRTALWSEIANGYEPLWERVVRPRTLAYRDRFESHLRELCELLPDLSQAEWVLCLPLRRHGRVLHRGEGPPLIGVGVADGELGVLELHPLMQGCHEFLVWQSPPGDAKGPAWSTVAGRPGHDAFRRVEDAALARGDRLFANTRWQEARHAWRSLLVTAGT